MTKKKKDKGEKTADTVPPALKPDSPKPARSPQKEKPKRLPKK